MIQQKIFVIGLEIFQLNKQIIIIIITIIAIVFNKFHYYHKKYLLVVYHVLQLKLIYMQILIVLAYLKFNGQNYMVVIKNNIVKMDFFILFFIMLNQFVHY